MSAPEEQNFLQSTTGRVGGAVLIVALLLAGWVALANTGESDSDLATEAIATSSTSTSVPETVPTTETVARKIGESEPSAQPVPSAITQWTSETPWNFSEAHRFSSASEDEEAIAEPAEVEPEETPEALAATTPVPTGPAPVNISRPSCAAGLGAPTTRTAPFTGKSAAIPAGMPAVVVKVSNNSSASRRALIGLDEADIVFEERIEASATRFFSVFHSSLPANVGPVRSGRTTDIQITQNLNRPVFAYSGSNQGVARQIKFAADNAILTPFINTDRAPFARDGRYSAPDNLFVDPASLGGCGPSGNPTAVFSYGPASSTTAETATSVSLQARSPYRFDWDGSKYVRSQSGTTHVTRSGAALAPDNVVILFVKYVPSQIDAASVDAETIGSGQAWVLRDRTITRGTWTRNKGHEAYTLKDGNGSNVNLAPGQTWVVLAPAGTASYN